ncbi:MAG: 1,4-alpha-glucan branching enzyme [Chthoniobacter sp.]|jgi:1,4-alpha-glucan branching enzyme|nr:1,4-alpha-glucan branching enzyme [Chthoniobacter sp.]
MSSGYLALVLHAHLPYVRHPEYEDFLEEDWLYEAITETYLPLLQVLWRLVDEGVPFQLTMSLTPTLCSMLRDPLLQDRYVRYIERAIALAKRELDRTQNDARLNELARMYLERFITCRNLFVDGWNRDIVGAFARLQERGVLEIITCAATHGFLPLMENFPEAVRAQICIARDHYRECFGRDPAGIWLPECGYVPGLDRVLQEVNIRWFIMDSHGLMFGNPRPRYAIYTPVFTPSGVAAYARDRESSKQVWSAEHGYPGDPAYRDFYRDIGFDLPEEELRPFLPANGPRKFTGIKYHRITGRTKDKDLYNRGWAMGAADSHAGNFMWNRAEQIKHLREVASIDPIVVSPFDAELFGHWWFEGPEFLNLFIRKAAYDQQEFKLTTPTAYLGDHNTLQLVVPSASSWGHKGYWEVWLDESNSWIYPHLHAAARRMSELARQHKETTDPLLDRALRQLARELLLAQSSDWAFLMKTGTARDYATKRTKDHLLRFTRLYDMIRCKDIDEKFLQNSEWRDNIFPNLDWRYYV